MESSGLCIDPEEDEIFFYGITEKEAKLKVLSGDKSIQLGMEILPGSDSDKNKQISKEAGLKIEPVKFGNDAETVVKIERVSDPKLTDNSSDMTIVIAEGNLKICENTVEEPTFLNGETNLEEYISNENEREEIDSTSIYVQKEKQREINKELNHNNTSIHEDHNYSTPVKTIIDKNILKTPKSVVKADKDGGFLKVLSEIALVKAQIDENTLNDASLFSDTLLKEEINDDNKENEKWVQQNIIKPNEDSHTKFYEESVVKKSVNENQKEQFSGKCEMLKQNSLYFDDCKNLEDSDTTSEIQILENRNGKSISTHDSNASADDTNKCEVVCANSCKESLNDSNDFEVIFENLTTDANKLAKEEEVEKLVDISILIKQDSYINNSSQERHDSDQKSDDNQTCENIKKKEFQIQLIPKINILDETLHMGKDDEVCCASVKNVFNTEDEHQKKFLRRRTMNLLQELSEIVTQEQVQRESDGVRNAGLSEECAKVIQKLKAAGIDDSITSPDQYFDLDSLNETFLSSEVSDILNGTLSKPLDLLTNKDVELLLEKINTTTLQDKFQSQTKLDEVLDAEKENLCQNKTHKPLNRKFEKAENVNEKTPSNKFVSFGNSQKTPVSFKSNVYMTSEEYDHEQKCATIDRCRSENKLSTKPLTQSQTNQNEIRVAGCRTAEKAVKTNIDTRIPKLASTASKIPIKGSRDGQMQNRNPVLNRTPYYKATNSLKFNNIKSPVQAYINAKAPVLISNVKGKPEAGLNVWMKDMTSDNKIARPQVETSIVKNVPKSNLPFVKYRSAIPLKLEKSPESRLPRLAPKMHKLILGNSPVIAKHEGRIKLNASSRPQTSMNESSIMMNPNEVSVIVRKVALNSNIKK